MKRCMWIALAAAAASGTVHAQAYRWVDSGGHIGYGDTPPPGVKATPLRDVVPAGPAAPAPAQDTGSGSEAKRGPLTPAEQELEFRRRMKEAQDAAAKADKERREAAEKKANCETARQSLQTLESGQRIAQVDSNGERYFISDAQRAQDTARARESVSQWCK